MRWLACAAKPCVVVYAGHRSGGCDVVRCNDEAFRLVGADVAGVVGEAIVKAAVRVWLVSDHVCSEKGSKEGGDREQTMWFGAFLFGVFGNWDFAAVRGMFTSAGDLVHLASLTSAGLKERKGTFRLTASETIGFG